MEQIPEPELINTDPYGEGWILLIEASDDLQSDLQQLIHGDAVPEFVERQIRKAEEERAKLEGE